uniref:3-hydroxyisobutyryl-CoA hydrolase n=1 Tax=Setaria italica TaxID=4555 RepID=K3ZN63_SETIT
MASLPFGSTASVDSNQLLVETNGSTQTLILNRPKQLNALSSTMIKELLRCFIAYEKDDGVKLLIMKGKGRAFCAGGDAAIEGWKWGANFCRNLYLLNYIIAICIKHQVSLLTGIVMGGGTGVSLHGRFRVATEKTIFAMPETTLGLFPDVGGSYFLSRLPGFYGEYVALAGARLDGAEVLACGLATHFVHSNRLLLLEESLKKVDTSNPFIVLEIINKCFSKRTVEEIISSLEQVASNLPDEWVDATIQSLKNASPTSLKISLRSIREGRTQTVGECLRREYRMVCHWMPPRLEQVHNESVQQYFSTIDDPRWEELNLPTRHSHGRNIKSKL